MKKYVVHYVDSEYDVIYATSEAEAESIAFTIHSGLMPDDISNICLSENKD